MYSLLNSGSPCPATPNNLIRAASGLLDRIGISPMRENSYPKTAIPTARQIAATIRVFLFGRKLFSGNGSAHAGLSPAVWRSEDRLASQKPPIKDRKSTRLNSSHGYISYAVFCLKKKNACHERRTSCVDAT